MKLKLKIMTAVLLIAGLCPLTSVSQAQQYDATALHSNSVANGVTSNVNAVVTLTKADDVALELSIVGNAGSTNGNVTATFTRSVDGVNYDNGFTVIAAASGATRVTTVTNVTVGSVGYLQLTTLANAASSNLDIQVTRALKPIRH